MTKNRTRVLAVLLWITALSCGAATSGFAQTQARAAGTAAEDSKRAVEQALDRGDYKKAYALLRPLAEAGDPWAQVNYGGLTLSGLAGRPDPAEACKWFQRAAEQGSAPGQSNLGECYYRGEGVAKDWARAVEWFQKAADQGDPAAQNNLGAMYAQGEGVTADVAEAVKWLERAASQGYPQAMHNLSKIYRTGRPGLPKDYRSAYKWTILACAKGYQPACMYPRALEEDITVRELYEAREEIRQWAKLHPEAMGPGEMVSRPK
jgi:TPR repeat protein